MLSGGARKGITRMKSFQILTLIVGAVPAVAQPAASVRISGFVHSAANGEVVRYAVIAADGVPITAESNQDGFFVLSVKAGTHVIRVRSVGYLPFADTLTVTQSVTRDYRLTPKPFQLEEVTVSSTRDTSDIDPGIPEMSTARLDIKTVKLVPVVLGESDPIRTLTLLPGVKTTSDFSTGLSVRGGGPDQNLILLDESTIYNPSHVFGFFSVFNADAVDDVKLYKGAIPARFGGRLSSVLDIRQREGNANEFEAGASVGLLSSRVLAEGPLPGRLGSFLVAGRRTYADLFLKLSSNRDLKDNVAYFYDLNAKTNFRLGSTGTLMLSGYFGRDRYALKDRFSASWGNAAGTLRWNQAFGNRWFSKVAFTTSDYDYGLQFLGTGRDLAWTARIASTDLSIDESVHLGNGNAIEFGAQVTRPELKPGSIRPVGNSAIVPLDLQPRHGIAPAVHASHEIELASWLSIRYGVRLAGFRRVGEATIYQYGNNRPAIYNSTLGRYERGQIVDSVRYGAGDLVSSYTGLEPRISARIGLDRTSSLKLSFARTHQYLHLISNTNSPTPVDIWEPVGPYVKPQRADQAAVGYASTLGDGNYDISVEGYYKWLSRVTDFVDGADLGLNDRIETELLQGNGRAYGLELYVRKRGGKLTGWVSYTLSRTERRVQGRTAEDPGVNGGKYYPSPYDKTHDLAVVGLYPVGRKWTLSGTFVLSSGLPATFPESRYRYNGLLLVEYSARNAYRLPAYHRLDLTLTRTSGTKQLQFGLYNVYNRFNAQSITFRPSDANPLALEAVQSSIFGLVPSISFSFKF